MAAGNNDQIRGRAGLQLLKGLGVAGEDFLSHGKALGVGESFAVIDYANTESNGVSGFRYGSGDMTSSKKINDWLRENRFYKISTVPPQMRPLS